MSKEHKYSNGEITIHWKKDLCIHSTICWKGLRSVFAPGERPWIRPEGASTEAIVAQVRKCPSGALTYTLESAAANVPAERTARPGAVVEIKAQGPLVIRDTCVVHHEDGTIETRDQATAFCRCGGSRNKPYCDGSHRRAEPSIE